MPKTYSTVFLRAIQERPRVRAHERARAERQRRKSLPQSHKIYFYLSTTSAQNDAIKGVYAAQGASGKRYDTLDNKCIMTVRDALNKSGLPGRLLLQWPVSHESEYVDRVDLGLPMANPQMLNPEANHAY